MKIYTKTGDTGTTSLVHGTRVSKSDERISSYGDVDELNSWIGMLRDLSENEARRNLLKEIQDRLFTIGALLATEPAKRDRKALPPLLPTDITLLETEMDTMDTHLEPMRAFVLPGGHTHVSFCHVARTVCRRAERSVVRLSHEEPVDELVITYLNRLSDYLFVLSRLITKEQNAEEIAWKPRL